MATKVRRTRRLKTTPADPEMVVESEAAAKQEADPAIEALLEKLRDRSAFNSIAFTTGSPTTAQAMKEDGTYRTAPLAGTEEFTYSGVYLGKRGKIIFQFQPINPDYKLYEWDETKVFSSIGTTEFERTIVAMLGCEIAEYDRAGDAFAIAKSQFCARFRKAAETEKRAAQEAEIKANQSRMEENPLFGMF